MSLTNFFKLPNIVLSKNICTISKIVSLKNNSPLLLNSVLKNELLNRRHAFGSPMARTKTNDLTQALVSLKYLRLIKKAIRESGPVVKENKKLHYLLHKAQEHKIPPDFIEFVSKISVEARATVGLLELLLFSNCHFIVQYEDIDYSITKHHILTLSEQSDAQLIHDNLKWSKNFDQKGIISMRKDASSSLFKNSKEAKLALPVQAVTEEFDPEGIPFWQLYCDPSDLHKVKRHLTEKNCDIEEAFVGYIPKKDIMVPNHVKSVAQKLIVELNKVPTIDNVYTNIM